MILDMIVVVWLRSAGLEGREFFVDGAYFGLTAYIPLLCGLMDLFSPLLSTLFFPSLPFLPHPLPTTATIINPCSLRLTPLTLFSSVDPISDHRIPRASACPYRRDGAISGI